MTLHVPASLTGERSGSKVAALFPAQDDARAAAARLEASLALQKGQVLVVTPQDRRAARKLEPESHGIFRTILVAHYKLGLAGLVVGLLVFALMYGLGLQMVVRSPAAAGLVIASFGTVFGLFAGGLVSLRPDHDPYISKVRDALSRGQSAVVVHAFDAGERDRAAAAFSAMGKETIATL